MILHNETFNKFGYSPDNVTANSHKPIIVQCSHCSAIRMCRKKDALRDCQKCYQERKSMHTFKSESLNEERALMLFFCASVHKNKISLKGRTLGAIKSQQIYAILGIDSTAPLTTKSFKKTLLAFVISQSHPFRTLNWILNKHRKLSCSYQYGKSVHSIGDSTELIEALLILHKAKFTKTKQKHGTRYTIYRATFYINGEWVFIGE